jgi:DNA-binding CsgD family transcriptional regulator
MMSIKEKEYRDILNFVYTLNCCQDEQSFLDTLMPSMVQLFHTDCVTFHRIQGYPWHIKVMDSRSFKSSPRTLNEDKFYPGLYQDNYYQQSPLLKEAIKSKKMIFKIGESISLQEWERSDMYNRFIAPQNLYWEMFLTLRWKNNLEGMITLWRSKDQGNYGGLDIEKAGLLAPHLMLATRNVITNERLAQKQRKTPEAADVCTEGMLLLDHRLKPLYFNPKARQICLQINNQNALAEEFREDVDFSIPPAVIRNCEDLMAQLKAGDQPILWPKESMLGNGRGQRFLAECSLMWKAERQSSQPNFIIILNDDPDINRYNPDPQAKFGLSKREMDIIYFLNQGLSYDEIGGRLFISKQTVHTHVKNIYRKLGAKSRIELYRYVQPESWNK